MRRVPNCLSAITNLDQNTVENLIQLTLAQAKARGQPIKDLEERHHSGLRTTYREFEELLQQAITSGSIPSPSSAFSSSSLLGSFEIEVLFRQLIFSVYLLGSSSPDPAHRDGRKRTAKAMKIRKKGWEEPVEKAIAQAFKMASPNLPEDKDIIKVVHAEMDRLGIKLALRKRIRPHRKYAEMAAEYAAKHPGVEMDEDIPF
jgi:hypothetical protein